MSGREKKTKRKIGLCPGTNGLCFFSLSAHVPASHLSRSEINEGKSVSVWSKHSYFLSPPSKPISTKLSSLKPTSPLSNPSLLSKTDLSRPCTRPSSVFAALSALY
ncbi:hypothetical protein CKAN_00632400 [Cinnamomum micranthum f. kanehirae]|uniref:Uncharacterized protein n=1 Tax=Cinnamomum micranthum f. kanehirae TaxID=337451 RepID=A0A3S3MZD8_9MAGN|nr:hypothetical protein CKAN_00632400 [Cinnamomum micranthum f. kanehirae]